MFQLTLLLLELLVLAGAVWVFAMTRRVAERVRDPQPFLAEGLDMVQEVTELVEDLQSTVDGTRKEWKHRQSSLEQTLAKVETVTDELRDLLDAVEDARECSALPAPAPLPVTEEASSALSYAQCVAAWGRSLTSAGLSESIVARRLSQVREFTFWLNRTKGPDVELAPLSPEIWNEYILYLNARDYQGSTIKRKLSALESFLAWVHALANPVVKVEGPIRLVEAREDRYDLALQLVRRGMDLPTITERTGLEREAVRMLLTTGARAVRVLQVA